MRRWPRRWASRSRHRRSSRARRRSRLRSAARNSCRPCSRRSPSRAKRNTDAIEVGSGAMMAGRIVEYKPAAVRPFDDVKAEIHLQLVRQGAAGLAQKAGQRETRAARAGEERSGRRGDVFEARVAGAQPGAAGFHQRGGHADLPGRRGEGAGLHRRPGDGGGFSIYRLVKVILPPDVDPGKVAAARAQNRRDAESRGLRGLRRHAQGKGQGRGQPEEPREEVKRLRGRQRTPGRGPQDSCDARSRKRLCPTQ